MDQKHSNETDGSETLGLVSQKRKKEKIIIIIIITMTIKLLRSNQCRSSGEIIITSISIISNLKFESKQSLL